MIMTVLLQLYNMLDAGVSRTRLDFFLLKTIIKERKTNYSFSLLLALLLVSSNVFFSGHVSGHQLTDTGICSICVLPGHSGDGLVPDIGTVTVEQSLLAFMAVFSTSAYSRISSYNHLSRAPPKFY